MNGDKMRHINDINLKKELSDADLLRLLNFCETEFGYYGEYEFNNTEGLMELIDSFEFNTREIKAAKYGIPRPISNGELKEMIQDCFQEEICFDR